MQDGVARLVRRMSPTAFWPLRDARIWRVFGNSKPEEPREARWVFVPKGIPSVSPQVPRRQRGSRQVEARRHGPPVENSQRDPRDLVRPDRGIRMGIASSGFRMGEAPKPCPLRRLALLRTAACEAGVRTLRSAAAPNPRKNPTMEHPTTRNPPIAARPAADEAASSLTVQNKGEHAMGLRLFKD